MFETTVGYLNLGDLESWKGNLEESSVYLNEAVRLYEEETDTKGIATVLRKQSIAAYRISDYVKLRAVATTALQHCRALNDALGIAEASFYLGFSVLMLGKPYEALAILHESLDICRTHGNDVGAVQCLEKIGEIQRSTGQKQAALSTLDEAVSVASRSGDRLGMVKVLKTVGLTHSDLSDFAKSADALSEAITITRGIGWEGGLSTTLQTMGSLKTRTGDYCEAEELFQKSISTARQIRDRFRLARALEELGECFRRQSKLDEASPVFEEACLLWHDLAQERRLKRIASTLVELKSTQRKWDTALLWHDHIITVCRNQKQQSEVTDHLRQKAEILVKLQRYDEAALHFETAIVNNKENEYSLSQEPAQLCAIPKTTMKWECRLPLLCDMKKLQRQQPQLTTAVLKLPISVGHGEL
ncbi:hypothetical protein M407DRAFT_26988 [Tulasnella calospora MUT 4182]|uniref:Tetratricopeptide repeat protein 29 n=1 Tax=Tulasnella calospora MUT 4182 TaxID=1051891 RepID=A0A0C3Q3Y6_9AGAM|nr:hypothetical protein M407DRAFT_26988 [Tulasnella calospora MUT 4182]